MNVPYLNEVVDFFLGHEIKTRTCFRQRKNGKENCVRVSANVRTQGNVPDTTMQHSSYCCFSHISKGT